MAENVSVKEIRGHIRNEIARAKAWAALDGKLVELGDLDQAIAQRRHVTEKLGKEIAAARADADKAKAEARRIAVGAKEKADAALARAKETEDNAKAKADEIVAAAKAEADSVLEVARKRGAELAGELEGKIPPLQAEVETLTAERTRLSNDVAALEGRKTAAEVEIEKLRRKFAG